MIFPPRTLCNGMLVPGSPDPRTVFAVFMETLQAIGGFILLCSQFVHIRMIKYCIVITIYGRTTAERGPEATSGRLCASSRAAGNAGSCSRFCGADTGFDGFPMPGPPFPYGVRRTKDRPHCPAQKGQAVSPGVPWPRGGQAGRALRPGNTHRGGFPLSALYSVKPAPAGCPA